MRTNRREDFSLFVLNTTQNDPIFYETRREKTQTTKRENIFVHKSKTLKKNSKIFFSSRQHKQDIFYRFFEMQNEKKKSKNDKKI